MSPQALTPPISTVLIGIDSEIARRVTERLRPEWEIIRFIQSVEAAKEDLPYLLEGREPPHKPTNDIGTQRYTQPTRAVLFGRGFSQKEAEVLYDLFKNVGTEPVLWVAGATVNLPGGRELPHGFAPPEGVDKIVVRAFRKALEKWRGEGGVRDELVLY
ncbi:hypothetical protein GGS21DRAFT_492959 [Xylaria nigripes]|nr:hypothetical protein GGS21DRAFT_492959 [Xylaria nigripes]